MKQQTRDTLIVLALLTIVGLPCLGILYWGLRPTADSSDCQIVSTSPLKKSYTLPEGARVTLDRRSDRIQFWNPSLVSVPGQDYRIEGSCQVLPY